MSEQMKNEWANEEWMSKWRMNERMKNEWANEQTHKSNKNDINEKDNN